MATMLLISYTYTYHIGIPNSRNDRSASSSLLLLICLTHSQSFPRPKSFLRYEPLRRPCKTSLRAVIRDWNLALFMQRWNKILCLALLPDTTVSDTVLCPRFSRNSLWKQLFSFGTQPGVGEVLFEVYEVGLELLFETDSVVVFCTSWHESRDMGTN